MECSYAPYNWTQPDESNGAVPIRDSADYAYGYDVMMAKYLAEQMGMELEIVRLDWDSLVMAVQSGTVDCVAYPDMKLLDFSGTEDDFAVSDEEINIGISVQKGNTALLDRLNEALATLTTDDFARMMDEAIAVQPLSEG